MAHNSNRKYQLIIVEPIDGLHNITLDMDAILYPKDKNAFEYIYALQEITDKVLDLHRGEAMYFSPNRDNDIEKGILLRIE